MTGVLPLPGAASAVGGGVNVATGSASCSHAPAALPAAPPLPTQFEVDLARNPGNSPEQVSAREKIVRAFYHGREGLGHARCEADLQGIDLTQPVEVVDFPPPEEMRQYVRKGGKIPAIFFDPAGGQSAESLGLCGDSAIRELATFKTAKGQGLLCTAAPIKDDWSDPKKPVVAGGGGRQMVIDRATRSVFTGV